MLAVSSARSAAPQSQQPAQEPASQAAAPAPKAPAPAQASPAQAAPAEGAGQRVFIDPATGKIREPEPAEVAALEAAGARRTLRTLAAPSMLIEGPGDALGMSVPEDLMSYSVATINADGSVSMECVTGKKAADAAARAPKPTQTGARKEHDHDR